MTRTECDMAERFAREKSNAKTALWAGVLAIVNGLPRETGGTRRSVGEFAEGDNGSTMRATYEVEQPDGSDKVYVISVTVQESRGDRDEQWGPGSCADRADPSKRVVVGGEHYLIGDGTNGFRGFGGRRFDIEFFDGRKVTTRNLWHHGVIPPKWRERYPDNARFVKAAAEQSSPSQGSDRG